MRVLAVDVGAGTQDILLYDDGRNIENCVKMVLPSSSRVFAARVRATTDSGEDVFVKGGIIGGGVFAHALRRHLDAGFRVVMTEKAAYTVRNDLEQVRGMGIEVLGESEPAGFGGVTIDLTEVNLRLISSFLREFNEDLSKVDAVAVAVQDHGVSPAGVGDRRFRIRKMRELLEERPVPERLAFLSGEIPMRFLRMRSVAEEVGRQMPDVDILVMDTASAAIYGCLADPNAKVAGHLMVVNVGNDHTLAAIVLNGEITGLLEHHTQMISGDKMKRLLPEFADGKLSDEDVFEDDGHGMFYLSEPPTLQRIKVILATGPNRELLKKTGLDVVFAAPAGDVMMTGPIGLIKALKAKLGEGKSS